MRIDVVHVGDVYHVTAEFLDENDVPTDPTTVSLEVLDASGNTDTYTYPASLTRDSAGNFSKDIECDEPGRWHGRWISTGDAAGGEPFEFRVASSPLS